MAKPYDMPEFHSVKVSLTENIPAPPPTPQYPPETTAIRAINATSDGFTGCYMQLTIKGGQAHV
ncbi:hypothetical protein SG34_016020 [Thalassomonas viridans]|uniref:Uncharacterized protein n=1 Tax=Thalassomonas viridans TaxID=137584 RepID=A0AAE9Z0I7_9GAMM|nr:hypothetical protein [Thalassomonas viridans]WDE02948.1 hypothetical protein SG34_016020 [Thalassomonas viridans]